MRDPRVELGNRGIAAVLAFLIPGAGHFYQGRRVKGSIFTICILSTFVAGLVLGQGQPVYSQVVHAAPGGFNSAQLQSGKLNSERSLGYYAQLFVGLPALPALVQSLRIHQADNAAGAPTTSVDEQFEGDLLTTSSDGERRRLRVQGRLQLEPARTMSGSGSFTGTSSDGETITVELDGRAILGKPVFGAPGREVRCEAAATDTMLEGQLIGTVQRSFTDWFQAPRDNEELDRMHGTLSQIFDVACVFTWIAGLLNVMAIWDAFDGPAYGYGDEDNESDGDESRPNE